MAIDPVKPVQSAETPTESQAAVAHAEKHAESATRFGPAYVLDQGLKPASKLEMNVPFVPASVGKTLSALPPINPIGAASLTRLSLVKMIEAGNPKGPKSGKAGG